MSRHDKIQIGSQGSRGFAYLELAMWMTIMLPVLLLAAGVIGVVHDQFRMHQIPVSALREFTAPGLRMRIDGASSRLEVNSDPLIRTLRSIRGRIVQDAQMSLVGGLSEISAVACYWVYRVDTMSGRLVSREREVCDSIGPISRQISFASELNDYVRGAKGYPLQPSAHGPRYIEYVVLLGAGMAGQMPLLSSLQHQPTVQFVQVSLPREEVSL